jgi:predicted CXXCH cytochrome family protein
LAGRRSSAVIGALHAMIAVAVLASVPVASVHAASFVGGKLCAECHEQAYRDWSGSHHDLAMQEATKATVLGDFDDASFTAHGVTSRFIKRNDEYFVHTEGPDGKLRDYKIDYTFGVYPLQQYLVAFPGGRRQALGIAWDARPSEQGGQRWFHLYGDEHIVPGDILHWTQINQNWNYMCADCHSTNLRRNYDIEKDRYETAWSELDVSCEACHGPGSSHLAWARGASGADAKQAPSKGLAALFEPRENVHWTLKESAVTASRPIPPPSSHRQVESCGRCHSRRAPLGDAIDYPGSVLDSYRVALLAENLYHADGQIRDEVYVYGSFLQSKMYAAGVTCSDCHNPHSLKLRAEGNDLCTRCHRPESFDTPAHHFHATGTAGSQCVDCHAPETTYMVVDPRRDHSFRIPRPDLSVKLGVPNACSGCHGDRSAQWAAGHVSEWHGPIRKQSPHFGEALDAGRRADPTAQRQLLQIAMAGAQPAIVRATALDTLGQTLNRDSFGAIEQGLRADSPLVRLAALGALERLSPRDRVPLVFPLLQDPVRGVRLEAARLLAPVPLESFPPEPRKTLAAAFADYEQAHRAIADRPESLMTLANFYRDRLEIRKSEATYQEAIARHPAFAPAYVNLADLYRSLEKDEQAETLLRAAVEIAPDQADIRHAYGLLLIRHQRYAEATKHLGRAAELRPDNSRYSYIYALSMQKVGDTGSALSILSAAHMRHPNDRDIVIALATMSRDSGDFERAVHYATALVALSPSDAGALQLLESLRAQQR